MKKAALWFLLCLIWTAGCNGEKQAEPKLEAKNLKLQSYKKDGFPHYYEPVDKKAADKALPFPVVLPDRYPFKEKIGNSVISDWGKKKKLSVETNIMPQDVSSPYYMAMYTFNHPSKVSHMIKGKQYTKQVELKDGTKAYFTSNDSYMSVGWKEGDYEHLLEYAASSGTLPKNAKKELLKSASSVGGGE